MTHLQCKAVLIQNSLCYQQEDLPDRDSIFWVIQILDVTEPVWKKMSRIASYDR